MKYSKDQLSNILHENLGIHKNNCETVVDFMIAMQSARTVNLSQMSNYTRKGSKIKQLSVYKNYQRLVHGLNICKTKLAKLIVNMYDLVGCKLTIAMDRTNWKYGSKNINLLVLSICVLGTSIPIYWLELDKRGNSNTDERKQVINDVLKDFGNNAISYLLADREFVGNDWFECLQSNAINFVVRIKNNFLLEHKGETISAHKLFKQADRITAVTKLVKINGLTVLAQAIRSSNQELVIVISNDLQTTNLLDIYAKRWKIECLFGQLKTRGFNFEDTHITIQERLNNLMKLLVLSFCVAYLVGLVHASVVPIQIKKHGRQLKSYFRHGLDKLISIIQCNLQLALKIITTCLEPNIYMETKCKKLICVMY
jgi:hypothetical protein